MVIPAKWCRRGGPYNVHDRSDLYLLCQRVAGIQVESLLAMVCYTLTPLLIHSYIPTLKFSHFSIQHVAFKSGYKVHTSLKNLQVIKLLKKVFFALSKMGLDEGTYCRYSLVLVHTIPTQVTNAPHPPQLLAKDLNRHHPWTKYL